MGIPKLFLTKSSYFNVRNLYTTRQARQNLYEVLNVSSNCSQAEIRNSFLKLSKKYHPDRNKDKNSHKKFVKISEAYNVLSKPWSRREYDIKVSFTRNNPRTVQNAPPGSIIKKADDIRCRVRRIFGFDQVFKKMRMKASNCNSPLLDMQFCTVRRIWRDEVIWEMRNPANDRFYAEKPYYGVKGWNKVSNSKILAIFLSLTALGIALQVYAIRHSITFRREHLTQKSKEIEELHTEIRARAAENGNEEQLKILKEKIHYSYEE